MSDVKNKRAHIVADFNDIGTGEAFKAGDTPLIEAGAYANFEAAGLVRAPDAPKPTPSATAKRKPAASKPKPKTVPAPVVQPVAASAIDPAPVDPAA
jgi:hypothetical protein